MTDLSDIRDQLFKREYGEEPTDDLKRYKWTSARIAWLQAWSARGMIEAPYREAVSQGDIVGWLRRRQEQELVVIPGKLAGEIAYHIENLSQAKET